MVLGLPRTGVGMFQSIPETFLEHLLRGATLLPGGSDFLLLVYIVPGCLLTPILAKLVTLLFNYLDLENGACKLQNKIVQDLISSSS